MPVKITLTKTGLDKGYFDAIKPLQELLKETGIVDFDSLEIGVKKPVEVKVLSTGRKLSLSMYRPKTKNGKFKRVGLSKALVKELDLREGDSLSLTVDTGKLIAKKIIMASATKSYFPDRFLDWLSSKPGAVRRPFANRGVRPLGSGPDSVLKTGLVRKLEELVANLCANEKPEGWIKPKGIFLVGGAGNGKSDGLEEFLTCLARKCSDPTAALSRLEQIFSQKKRKLVIDLVNDLQGLNIGYDQIEIVQDATEGGLFSDGAENNPGDLLLEDFNAVEQEGILLICNINRGILEAARMNSANDNLNTPAATFLKECTFVIDPFAYGQKCWPSESGHYIWPLDLESLVGDCESPVFIQILEYCIDSKELWSSEVLSVGEASSISYNRSILGKQEIKESFCKLLNDYEVLSGERWTFRDLFSLVSYLMTGGFLRDESEFPQQAAERLSLPPDTVSPLPRVKNIMDALRTTIPQLLFPNWPSVTQAEKDLGKMNGGNLLLGNLVNYLKVKLPQPRLPVQGILREKWSQLLDPALGTQFEISHNGETFTEAELEDSFAVSVRNGFSKIENFMPNLLGNIEKTFLELLIDIEENEINRSLSENSGPAQQSSARALQVWLRKFGLVVVKRFIGFHFGYGNESSEIRFFQENVNNYRLLLEICDEFEQILGERDISALRVELNLGLCHPRGLFRDQGFVMEASLPRIRHKLLPKISERPSPDSARFLFDYGDGEDPIEIPFTFQLFKRLAASKEMLVPACVDPMVRGFMDRYRMGLEGKAVRSWGEPQGKKITIALAGEPDLFRGNLENFQNRGVGNE